ncbi:MAG: chemotaxis response regulator protein-glutamate methylesterase [Gammaproteobacteria bacterium]|nr:chemotaxis response regulator protein-glutamate methylesterase [Gammaproteobacteria bacterium]MDH5651422.1 chemotaxis response regulator protein-glutamate methylesterase [Gammaproteobacteria bacterium]
MTKKVLIVDDSAVIRQVLTDIISKDPDLEVMAAVADPIFAMRRMEQSWPDVIMLDVEMPRMDGITFLKKVMSEHPTPIVMCSTLTTKGAETTMQAIAAGAVEIIEKPKINPKEYLSDESKIILDAVRSAAQANISNLHISKPVPQKQVAPKLTADAMLSPATGAMKQTTDRIVAMGTSTGGVQALEAVLTSLPRVCPGIVVVQHMPEKFTATFAQRLDSLCAMEVKEAENMDRVVQGRVLIAPGGKHLTLKRSGAQYHVEVVDGPLVSRHRPSVDVLFRSVAKFAGKNALGVIMTGMGDDGASGIKEMHDVGALTIAQDEATCVVYGMPKEAVNRGGIDRITSLMNIPQEIMNFYQSDEINRSGKCA